MRKLRIIFFLLINFHASFTYANVNCKELVETLLSSSSDKMTQDLSENTLKVFEQFYSSEDPRFFDNFLNLRFQEPGNPTKQRSSENILPFMDREILLFHDLGERFKDSYASLAMVGVVKIIKSNDLQKYMPAYKMLLAKDLPIANHFGETIYKNTFILFQEYIPGPTLKDLTELHNSGKIQNKLYDDAINKFLDFRKLINREIKNLKTQEDINSKLFDKFEPNETNSVFYNGQWYFYHP